MTSSQGGSVTQYAPCNRCGGPRYWGDNGCATCKARDTVVSDSYARMHGGRYYVYVYCVSLLLVTLRRPSGVKFVRFDQSRVRAGLPYTLLSLVAGWWGFPFGPVFTIEAVYKNLRGGLDVTAVVVAGAPPLEL